jgi:hypothetical protein
MITVDVFDLKRNATGLPVALVPAAARTALAIPLNQICAHKANIIRRSIRTAFELCHFGFELEGMVTL